MFVFRVLPEYCRSIDESEVMDNVFQLIFAFDEIVALGYRENVNLAQIQTFTKMDSHEEKVGKAYISGPSGRMKWYAMTTLLSIQNATIFSFNFFD